MSLIVNDAELRIWHQNTRDVLGVDPGDPDAVISDPLEAVTVERRADDVLDEVKLDLDHPGRGRLDEYDLRLGDRVEFNTTVTAGVGGAYGAQYGSAYGGGSRDISWTGRVQPTNKVRPVARDASIAADCTDWVGGVLSERTITGSWVGMDVGAVIRDIVEQVATEVDVSNVPDLGTTTDEFLQSADVWDAIVALAGRGDVLLTQHGSELHVTPLSDLTVDFALTPEDYNLPFDTQTADRVSNVVRVDSGVSRQQESGQGTVDSFERVTDTTRITHRLRARKSEIHSIELYIDNDPDSDDGLRVRLQADEGGAPIAISDEDSDIVRETVDDSDLPGEGWQVWWLPDHVLPDRDPWLIIEAEGGTGHDVGVDVNGVPAYRSYYPHPLNFEASDSDSIAEYGARDIRIERENLQTLTATRDAVLSELRRRAWPMKTITFEANSARAHALVPGDVIDVNEPSEDAVGEFIVVETSQTYDGETVTLQTEITAEWRKGILAPP